MVFYENCGLENLYGIVRYCQVKFLIPFLTLQDPVIKFKVSIMHDVFLGSTSYLFTQVNFS